MLLLPIFVEVLQFCLLLFCIILCGKKKAATGKPNDKDKKGPKKKDDNDSDKTNATIYDAHCNFGDVTDLEIPTSAEVARRKKEEEKAVALEKGEQKDKDKDNNKDKDKDKDKKKEEEKKSDVKSQKSKKSKMGKPEEKPKEDKKPAKDAREKTPQNNSVALA